MSVGNIKELPNRLIQKKSIDNDSIMEAIASSDPDFRELSANMDKWEEKISQTIQGTEYSDHIWEKNLNEQTNEIKINRGKAYEKEVFKKAKEVEKLINDKRKFKVIPKPKTENSEGTYNPVGVDLKLMIMNEPVNIELKYNKFSQMGGSSFRYAKNSNVFEPVTPIESEDLVIKTLLGAVEKVDNLIKFIETQEPKSFLGNQFGFPLKCTRGSWENARKQRLLVNLYLQRDSKFISDHYNRKKTYYIQIGGSGLYYMNENIFNILELPNFNNMPIKLCLRSGLSGVSERIIGNKEYFVGSALIRSIGRLVGRNLQPSPFSFDDPKTIVEMIESRIK